MYLTAHTLGDYRNIESLSFLPDQGVNVVCGDNGQGKTNLLESIFLLTGARSFRSGKDAALIRRGCSFASVRSAFFSEGREQRIHLTVSDKGRRADLNRNGEKKAASLAGHFCCVIFSPEHLELIKGAPENRRRFLDTALCQISPGYLSALKAYTRLLNQRNSLLKDSGYVSAALDLLEVYDEQFVQAAVQLTEMRRAFTAELLVHAGENYGVISNRRETLSFGYVSTLFGEQPAEPETGLCALAQAREADRRSGFSTLGPHRDDLAVTLDGESARLYGSQGQQRSAVLALKLAEAELMHKKLDERPVLLLDDVLSELDPGRQDFLIEKVLHTQAVITCCEPEFVIRRTDAKTFRMSAGRLQAL